MNLTKEERRLLITAVQDLDANGRFGHRTSLLLDKLRKLEQEYQNERKYARTHDTGVSEGKNEYQEAYKRLTSRDYKYADTESVYDDLKVLRPLVERATPKKPTIEDRTPKIRYVRTYVCPGCGNSLSGISCFCYHCGQALKWSDEE